MFSDGSPSTLGHDRIDPWRSTQSVHSIATIGCIGNWHLEGRAPVADGAISSLRPRTYTVNPFIMLQVINENS